MLIRNKHCAIHTSPRMKEARGTNEKITYIIPDEEIRQAQEKKEINNINVIKHRTKKIDFPL